MDLEFVWFIPSLMVYIIAYCPSDDMNRLKPFQNVLTVQVCFTLGTSRTVLRNEIKIYDKITKHHSPVKLLPNSCASHQSRSVVTFSVLYKQSKKADNTLGNTPDPVNEKTFDYQDKLPSLPVPDLSQTLRKYLNSAKPHLTEEEYRNTEVVVQNFEDGIGTHLQEKLLKRASSMRNWLETWWEDFLYLEGRDPIAPLVSFGVLGPYHYDYYQPQEGTQLERAATIVNFTLKYWKMIRTECLQPEKDKRGNPLCMNQFMKAFNNCRIPGLHKDRLISYFKTESQGVTPVHLVVLYNGRIFTFDALDENEDPLTPLELRLQFQRIIDMCKGEQVGPALGTLTGDNRTRWAENRSRLLALHPDNFNSLEIIQSSILVVSFDDYRPTDESDLMRNIIGGDPRNRWFDKGQCMVFYRNGLLATVCDHGPADAMVFVASTMYTYSQLMQCNGQWEGNTVIRDQNQPRELVFHIDDEITHEVERSAQLFTETANNIDCIIRHFQGYGKTYLRSKGLHPETHVQLAIQYAYFKLYNKPASTLQTATIRKFYHGRTETMRSCTVESGEWTKAMIDSNMSNQDKTELYLKAADTHNKLMSEVTNLQGCDRHLFGLKRIAEEEGIPVPDLYKDIAYARSGRGRIFTLMTSCIGYTGVSVGGTAATENAYVICYRIPSDEIVPTILTWKSSEETDAEQFCYTLFGCFEDMKRMLDSAKH